MSVTGDVGITSRYAVTGTTGTAGSVKESVSRSYSTAYADGTAAGAFDLAWSESRTLAAAAHTYDLTALAGPTGTVAFAEVVEVLIAITASTDPATLAIGGEGSANEWTSPFAAAGDKLNLRSGGRLLLQAPDATAYAVGGTNKLFKVDPGASTISIDLILKGRSV